MEPILATGVTACIHDRHSCWDYTSFEDLSRQRHCATPRQNLVQCGYDRAEFGSGTQFFGAYAINTQMKDQSNGMGALGSIQGHGEGFTVEGVGQQETYRSRSGPYTWRRKFDEAFDPDMGV